MLNKEKTGIPELNEVDLRLKGFKVHALPESTEVPVKAGRRDFYKMGLVNGDMTINYGGQLLEIKGTALFFVNPHVPHALVRRVNRTSGYACIFTETKPSPWAGYRILRFSGSAKIERCGRDITKRQR